MDKVKLVVLDSSIESLSKLKNIKLNTNGKKSRGKNLYKLQLRRIRRMFR